MGPTAMVVVLHRLLLMLAAAMIHQHWGVWALPSDRRWEGAARFKQMDGLDNPKPPPPNELEGRSKVKPPSHAMKMFQEMREEREIAKRRREIQGDLRSTLLALTMGSVSRQDAEKMNSAELQTMIARIQNGREDGTLEVPKPCAADGIGWLARPDKVPGLDDMSDEDLIARLRKDGFRPKDVQAISDNVFALHPADAKEEPALGSNFVGLSEEQGFPAVRAALKEAVQTKAIPVYYCAFCRYDTAKKTLSCPNPDKPPVFACTEKCGQECLHPDGLLMRNPDDEDRLPDQSPQDAGSNASSASAVEAADEEDEGILPRWCVQERVSTGLLGEMNSNKRYLRKKRRDFVRNFGNEEDDDAPIFEWPCDGNCKDLVKEKARAALNHLDPRKLAKRVADGETFLTRFDPRSALRKKAKELLELNEEIPSDRRIDLVAEWKDVGRNAGVRGKAWEAIYKSLPWWWGKPDRVSDARCTVTGWLCASSCLQLDDMPSEYGYCVTHTQMTGRCRPPGESCYVVDPDEPFTEGFYVRPLHFIRIDMAFAGELPDLDEDDASEALSSVFADLLDAFHVSPLSVTLEELEETSMPMSNDGEDEGDKLGTIRKVLLPQRKPANGRLPSRRVEFEEEGGGEGAHTNRHNSAEANVFPHVSSGQPLPRVPVAAHGGPSADKEMKLDDSAFRPAPAARGPIAPRKRHHRNATAARSVGGRLGGESGAASTIEANDHRGADIMTPMTNNLIQLGEDEVTGNRLYPILPSTSNSDGEPSDGSDLGIDIDKPSDQLSIDNVVGRSVSTLSSMPDMFASFLPGDNGKDKPVAPGKRGIAGRVGRQSDENVHVDSDESGNDGQQLDMTSLASGGDSEDGNGAENDEEAEDNNDGKIYKRRWFWQSRETTDQDEWSDDGQRNRRKGGLFSKKRQQTDDMSGEPLQTQPGFFSRVKTFFGGKKWQPEEKARADQNDNSDEVVMPKLRTWHAMITIELPSVDLFDPVSEVIIKSSVDTKELLYHMQSKFALEEVSDVSIDGTEKVDDALPSDAVVLGATLKMVTDLPPLAFMKAHADAFIDCIVEVAGGTTLARDVSIASIKPGIQIEFRVLVPNKWDARDIQVRLARAMNDANGKVFVTALKARAKGLRAWEARLIDGPRTVYGKVPSSLIVEAFGLGLKLRKHRSRPCEALSDATGTAEADEGAETYVNSTVRRVLWQNNHAAKPNARIAARVRAIKTQTLRRALLFALDVDTDRNGHIEKEEVAEATKRMQFENVQIQRILQALFPDSNSVASIARLIAVQRAGLIFNPEPPRHVTNTFLAYAGEENPVWIKGVARDLQKPPLNLDSAVAVAAEGAVMDASNYEATPGVVELRASDGSLPLTKPDVRRMGEVSRAMSEMLGGMGDDGTIFVSTAKEKLSEHPDTRGSLGEFIGGVFEALVAMSVDKSRLHAQQVLMAADSGLLPMITADMPDHERHEAVTQALATVQKIREAFQAADTDAAGSIDQSELTSLLVAGAGLRNDEANIVVMWAAESDSIRDFEFGALVISGAVPIALPVDVERERRKDASERHRALRVRTAERTYQSMRTRQALISGIQAHGWNAGMANFVADALTGSKANKDSPIQWQNFAQALRRGLIPPNDGALPPTWLRGVMKRYDRVDAPATLQQRLQQMFGMSEDAARVISVQFGGTDVRFSRQTIRQAVLHGHVPVTEHEAEGLEEAAKAFLAYGGRIKSGKVGATSLMRNLEAFGCGTRDDVDLIIHAIGAASKDGASFSDFRRAWTAGIIPTLVPGGVAEGGDEQSRTVADCTTAERVILGLRMRYSSIALANWPDALNSRPKRKERVNLLQLQTWLDTQLQAGDATLSGGVGASDKKRNAGSSNGLGGMTTASLVEAIGGKKFISVAMFVRLIIHDYLPVISPHAESVAFQGWHPTANGNFASRAIAPGELTEAALYFDRFLELGKNTDDGGRGPSSRAKRLGHLSGAVFEAGLVEFAGFSDGIAKTAGEVMDGNGDGEISFGEFSLALRRGLMPKSGEVATGQSRLLSFCERVFARVAIAGSEDPDEQDEDAQEGDASAASGSGRDTDDNSSVTYVSKVTGATTTYEKLSWRRGDQDDLLGGLDLDGGGPGGNGPHPEVVGVEPWSPAYMAGVRIGDVIRKDLSGVGLRGASQEALEAAMKVDGKISVLVSRDVGRYKLTGELSPTCASSYRSGTEEMRPNDGEASSGAAFACATRFTVSAANGHEFYCEYHPIDNPGDYDSATFGLVVREFAAMPIYPARRGGDSDDVTRWEDVLQSWGVVRKNDGPEVEDKMAPEVKELTHTMLNQTSDFLAGNALLNEKDRTRRDEMIDYLKQTRCRPGRAKVSAARMAMTRPSTPTVTPSQLRSHLIPMVGNVAADIVAATVAGGTEVVNEIMLARAVLSGVLFDDTGISGGELEARQTRATASAFAALGGEQGKEVKVARMRERIAAVSGLDGEDGDQAGLLADMMDSDDSGGVSFVEFKSVVDAGIVVLDAHGKANGAMSTLDAVATAMACGDVAAAFRGLDIRGDSAVNISDLNGAERLSGWLVDEGMTDETARAVVVAAVDEMCIQQKGSFDAAGFGRAIVSLVLPVSMRPLDGDGATDQGPSLADYAEMDPSASVVAMMKNAPGGASEGPGGLDMGDVDGSGPDAGDMTPVKAFEYMGLHGAFESRGAPGRKAMIWLQVAGTLPHERIEEVNGKSFRIAKIGDDPRKSSISLETSRSSGIEVRTKQTSPNQKVVKLFLPGDTERRVVRTCGCSFAQCVMYVEDGALIDSVGRESVIVSLLREEELPSSSSGVTLSSIELSADVHNTHRTPVRGDMTYELTARVRGIDVTDMAEVQGLVVQPAKLFVQPSLAHVPRSDKLYRLPIRVKDTANVDWFVDEIDTPAADPTDRELTIVIPLDGDLAQSIRDTCNVGPLSNGSTSERSRILDLPCYASVARGFVTTVEGDTSLPLAPMFAIHEDVELLGLSQRAPRLVAWTIDDEETARLFFDVAVDSSAEAVDIRQVNILVQNAISRVTNALLVGFAGGLEPTNEGELTKGIASNLYFDHEASKAMENSLTLRGLAIPYHDPPEWTYGIRLLEGFTFAAGSASASARSLPSTDMRPSRAPVVRRVCMQETSRSLGPEGSTSTVLLQVVLEHSKDDNNVPGHGFTSTGVRVYKDNIPLDRISLNSPDDPNTAFELHDGNSRILDYASDDLCHLPERNYEQHPRRPRHNEILIEIGPDAALGGFLARIRSLQDERENSVLLNNDAKTRKHLRKRLAEIDKRLGIDVDGDTQRGNDNMAASSTVPAAEAARLHRERVQIKSRLDRIDLREAELQEAEGGSGTDATTAGKVPDSSGGNGVDKEGNDGDNNYGGDSDEERQATDEDDEARRLRLKEELEEEYEERLHNALEEGKEHAGSFVKHCDVVLSTNECRDYYTVTAQRVRYAKCPEGVGEGLKPANGVDSDGDSGASGQQQDKAKKKRDSPADLAKCFTTVKVARWCADRSDNTGAFQMMLDASASLFSDHHSEAPPCEVGHVYPGHPIFKCVEHSPTTERPCESVYETELGTKEAAQHWCEAVRNVADEDQPKNDGANSTTSQGLTTDPLKIISTIPGTDGGTASVPVQKAVKPKKKKCAKSSEQRSWKGIHVGSCEDVEDKFQCAHSWVTIDEFDKDFWCEYANIEQERRQQRIMDDERKYREARRNGARLKTKQLEALKEAEAKGVASGEDGWGHRDYDSEGLPTWECRLAKDKKGIPLYPRSRLGKPDLGETPSLIDVTFVEGTFQSTSAFVFSKTQVHHKSPLFTTSMKQDFMLGRLVAERKQAAQMGNTPKDDDNALVFIMQATLEFTDQDYSRGWRRYFEGPLRGALGSVLEIAPSSVRLINVYEGSVVVEFLAEGVASTRRLERALHNGELVRRINARVADVTRYIREAPRLLTATSTIIANFELTFASFTVGESYPAGVLALTFDTEVHSKAVPLDKLRIYELRGGSGAQDEVTNQSNPRVNGTVDESLADGLSQNFSGVGESLAGEGKGTITLTNDYKRLFLVENVQADVRGSTVRIMQGERGSDEKPTLLLTRDGVPINIEEKLELFVFVDEGFVFQRLVDDQPNAPTKGIVKCEYIVEQGFVEQIASLYESTMNLAAYTMAVVSDKMANITDFASDTVSAFMNNFS